MPARRRLTRERRRFSSNRRSTDAFDGSVGLRLRGTRSASRKLADQPLERELPIPCLTALVLRNRPQDRAGTRDDAPLLHVAQGAGAFDVEESLDASLRLLRMLAARPARA